LNTIHAPSILNSPASVSWVPVCLPKFNPTGFLNAYISFLGKDDEPHKQDPNSSGATGTKPRGDEHTIHHEKASEVNQQDAGVALVYIGGGEFETTRTWCDAAAKVTLPHEKRDLNSYYSAQFRQKLESDGALKAIVNACREGPTEYTVSELGIPGLWHFVYKSRAQVQVTLPIFEDPYDDVNARRR
jgi:vacuolar fusion protein MON1